MDFLSFHFYSCTPLVLSDLPAESYVAASLLKLGHILWRLSEMSPPLFSGTAFHSCVEHPVILCVYSLGCALSWFFCSAADQAFLPSMHCIVGFNAFANCAYVYVLVGLVVLSYS